MSKVFVIAEAGVNHNGNLKYAKKLVDAAVSAGADGVKFQTFKAENLVRKDAVKAEYQEDTTGTDETQFEMLKKLELTEEMHEELARYCREKGILFLSTPFDVGSIEYLDRIGVSIMKIPSGEITNYPYLRKIGQVGKPVILSTGMSTLDEVEAAITVLKQNGNNAITVLHCNTEYPTPYEDVNLKAMLAMRDKFDLRVGYSDHTMGIEIPIAAVAMGAEVIEKHFTLDRNMDGPDHKASLEPEELKKMVHAIRNVELALGKREKVPSTSEMRNKTVARKSIVAAREVREGEVFTEQNLTTMRPGDGISPMQWPTVVGSKAKRNFKKYELIEL